MPRPGRCPAAWRTAAEAGGRSVNYGVVAKVMSAVDRAGVNQLSVLTVAE